MRSTLSLLFFPPAGRVSRVCFSREIFRGGQKRRGGDLALSPSYLFSSISRSTFTPRAFFHCFHGLRDRKGMGMGGGARGRAPICLLPSRCFSRFSTDFYKLLGVPKTATQKEIKQAYFKRAKQCHPDLNSNAPNMVREFQQLASAYETLGDPKRRAEYDRIGYQRYSQQQQYGPSPPSQDPNEVFQSVYEDMEVIQSAWKDFVAEMKEEFLYASQEADKNNWTPMYDLAKANSLLIVGVVVPVALLFRMPVAVGVALRFLLSIVSTMGLTIIRSGHAHIFAAYMWKKLVQIARDRERRRRPPKS
mmetsp:Transcript_20854/g.36590  ORF Transcript_20854/g.36590 Transcript_20854/m.36590 type:complete len:305 (-) Transcript_20854:141-1055(-)